MIFEDAYQGTVPPSPESAPLVAPLPVPPFAWFGGVKHHVERVRLEELVSWRETRCLAPVGRAWCGQWGWLNVYAHDQHNNLNKALGDK